MRIKFFSLKINLTSGGGSHHALDLKLRYLLSRGYDVSLTTLCAGENKFNEEPPYKIRECGFQGGFLEMQKYVCEFLKQEEKNADIFHFDGPSLIWGAGMYKKAGGKIPTIAFINNYTSGMRITRGDYQDLKLKERISSRLKDWLYSQKRYFWEKLIGLSLVNKMDLFLFDSPIIKKIYEVYGFNDKKLYVLPNFIDTEPFLNAAPEKVAPFNKKDNGLYLLYVGRLTFDKGVDVLIKAMDFLNHKDVFLNIVGDGPQKNYLLKLVKQYGLENKINICPWKNQAQLIQFYYYSDILVHPCRWPEPFGRTTVEAMSLGMPIITTPQSGSAWVMGHAGTTFKNGNAHDLKNKICFFLNNRNALSEYGGVKAKKRAKEFDYKLLGKQLENFIFQLAPKKSLER